MPPLCKENGGGSRRHLFQSPTVAMLERMHLASTFKSLYPVTSWLFFVASGFILYILAFHLHAAWGNGIEGVGREGVLGCIQAGHPAFLASLFYLGSTEAAS